MTKTQISAAMAFVLTLTGVMIFQFRTNARLKQELVVLRERPLGAVPSPQNGAIIGRGQETLEESANPDERELVNLREEAAALQEKVRSMRKAHDPLNEKEALWQRLGGDDFEIETVPGSPFVPGRYYTRELWADAGLDSASGALQTVLWAVRSGNVSRYFEAHKFRENLTPQQKASLIARMQSHGFGRNPAVDAIGIKINAAEGREDSPNMTYHVVLDRGEAQPPQHASYHFENAEGIWRLDQLMMGGDPPDEYVVPR